MVKNYLEELLHARQLKDFGKEEYDRILFRGMATSEARFIQTKLLGLGYKLTESTKSDGTLDETIGPETIKALRKYFTTPEGKKYIGDIMLNDAVLPNAFLERNHELEESPEHELDRLRVLESKYKNKLLKPYENQQDIRVVQRALYERGYNLSKSLKKDGAFDGIRGEECKQALLDWQKAMGSEE